MIFLWIAFQLAGEQIDAAQPGAPNRKEKPSEFEIGDLNKLMMQAVDNSSNQVKFATPPGEYVVHGRVLDEQGEPIAGAQVMLADTRRGLYMYLANFDVTDQQGRFVVRSAPSDQTIFVRMDEIFCSLQTGGAQDVVVQLPKTHEVILEKGTLTDLFNDTLFVRARENQLGRTTVADDHRTTFAESQAGNFWLAPGKYFVYGNRRLETTDDPVAGWCEFGEIDVVDKPQQSFQLGMRSGTRLTGTIGDYDQLMSEANLIGIKLSLSVSQPRSQSPWRMIETTVCNADGSFAFAPVPAGPSSLQVTKIFDPKAPPRGALRDGFVVNITRNEQLFRERIDVAGDEMEISLPIEREVNATADRVQAILDSQHPQPNVSWSWTDVQISQLAGLEDREGTIAELLRLLKSDDLSQRGLVIEALWRIRPINDETKAALVEALDDPVNAKWRSSILSSIKNMGAGAIEYIDLIISMRDDDQWRIRYGVADAMAGIGRTLIEPPDKMIDTSIHLLDDSHGMVRREAAGSLGILHSPRAIEALRKRMQDPYEPARVMAAWALLECSGEAEPSLTTLIELLETADYEARKEAAYYLKMFDHRAAAALPALRANTDYEKKPPFSGTRELIRYQLRSAAESAIAAIEAGIGWQAERDHFELRLDPAPQAEVNVLQFDAQWGEQKEGLELGILIEGVQSKYSIGDRIPIVLLLRNTTNRPIRFEIDRRLHDSGPTVSGGHYTSNTRLWVAKKHLVSTLPPAGVMKIPHTGLGLGENPKPKQQLWHPYVRKPKSGQHQISQRYRFEVFDEEKGIKTRVWLDSGKFDVEFL